jgi:peptidyl-prolyl cis-trans isomerase A (cyclophilin A)
MHRFAGVLALAACATITGCSSSTEETKKETASTKPEHAPETFSVNFDTSKGPVVVEVHRDWAPIGVDHFYTLVKTGFFNDVRFHRVARNFVVQFGINGNPQTNRLWSTAELPDDPVKEHNRKGTLTYATRGPNTRTTQLFFNLKDNLSLDAQGFAPIGMVTTGMDVVEGLYDSYGDMPPRGQGPDPGLIETQGNEYLQSRFPRLDYIKKAVIQ